MENVLSELIAELNQQQKSRTDIVSSDWIAILNGRDITIKTGNETHELTEHAHDQLAQILNIPTRYYERLQSTNPELLAQNINSGPNRTLMFRILDGKIIAVMSNSYLIIDNYDVLMCTLETIKKMHHHGSKVGSCEISKTKMYLEIHQIEKSFEIIEGVTVTPGILIQNSEVGVGAFRADLHLTFPGGHGMIRELPTHRIHKGRKIEPGVVEQQPREGPLWEWVANTINDAFNPITLNTWITLIRSNTDRITEKPLETVDRVCEDYQLTEQQKTTILNHFMALGDRTKYALANAVAMTAQETRGLDRSIMLERIAGKISAEPPQHIRVPLT